jgi:hypothetical protein
VTWAERKARTLALCQCPLKHADGCPARLILVGVKDTICEAARRCDDLFSARNIREMGSKEVDSL